MRKQEHPETFPDPEAITAGRKYSERPFRYTTLIRLIVSIFVKSTVAGIKRSPDPQPIVKARGKAAVQESWRVKSAVGPTSQIAM